MNTKLLKQKILDLAIRGKLTQQLESDGNTADLLKEISSTCHPERSAKGAKSKDPGAIIPLDKSEAPFEIPANWEWVRLKDLTTLLGDGLHGSPKYCENGDYYFVNGNNLDDGKIVIKAETKKVDFVEYQKYRKELNSNTILVSINGTIGNIAFYKDEKIILGKSACFFNLVSPELKQYIYCLLKTSFFLRYALAEATGSTIKNVSLETMRNFLIPLPPLAEQQRIVEKIQDAFAEIDSIENNKELLKTHIKQTRQKILDLAIHGKLVPQNKSDEPASVLLERITRDNPHYEKLTDVPFEIPDSWEWVKLGDVCKPIKRGKSPKYIEQSNILVFAQKCNQKDGPVSLEKALYLDESTLNKYPKEEFLQKGDVIINSTGTGTLGRVGHFNVDLPQGIKGIVPDSHVTTIRSSVVNSNYLYSYLKNKQSYLEKNGEGSTNQKELKPHTIYDLEFPLPPLAEQKRIVNKIEEIFASLDKISLHLV